LPFGTVVRVTNVATGKSTTCTVADRGPFITGRVIDLERRVFAEVASISDGVFQAEIAW
jgi:rare lipoprotein A